MRGLLILFCFALACSCHVNGQKNCKPHNPLQLDKFSLKKRLINDRFNHTISPNIIEAGQTEIETAIFFRHQYYGAKPMGYNPTSTLNAYSGIKARHRILRNLELQVGFTDLIVKTAKEIDGYGDPNLMSKFFAGTKYQFYGQDNNIRMALTGQVMLPLHSIESQFLLFETRLAGSLMVTDQLLLAGNIGGAFGSKKDFFPVYTAELTWTTKYGLEIMTEYYTNYMISNLLLKMNHRWLVGFGYYLHENTYVYVSFEEGTDSYDFLNKGRVDMGFTFRF